MQYGFIIPGGDLQTIVELAHEAETVGWDGVFYWDGIYIKDAGLMYDPWVVLAAIALRTEHVRIGAILTPLSRSRPWKVARETVTLDHLSNGRLVLPVGLGALDDGGFAHAGGTTSAKVLAELLGRSLEILKRLWRRHAFLVYCKHYHMMDMGFLPPP